MILDYVQSEPITGRVEMTDSNFLEVGTSLLPT